MNRPRPIVLFVLLLAICTSAAAAEVVGRTRELMGTYVTVSIWTDRTTDAEKAIDAAFARIDEIDRRFSTYKPDSEISAVNAGAWPGPVVVSEEFARVLTVALDAGKTSGGAFDITYRGLKAWDFAADPPVVPSKEEIARELPLVDYRLVTFDPVKRAVSFAKEGVSIGLGGVAKGYASDEAAAVLERAGFSDSIVNSGGDMLIAGSKGADPWRVGVQHPRAPRGELVAVIEGYQGAVVTSGDYERFFEVDGVRYHHILDPRTGEPARGSVSVTVAARRAIDADWLATAVFILGPEKGVVLVDSIDGAQCLILTDDGRRVTSTGFENAVAIQYRER